MDKDSRGVKTDLFWSNGFRHQQCWNRSPFTKLGFYREGKAIALSHICAMALDAGVN